MARMRRSCSLLWPCRLQTVAWLVFRDKLRGELTLAIAIKHENIIGAIQCTCGGPRLVQANPNRPIDKRGATIILSDEISYFKEGLPTI